MNRTVLSIDSSGGGCFSIALSVNNEIKFYDEYEDKITKHLFIALEQIKEELKDVDYLSFNSGPGSYTAIRAAAAALHGISIGLRKKVLCANTFEILAYKFLQQNDVQVQGKYLEIYLKSYNEQFLYNQVLDKNLSSVTKPVKISRGEMKDSIDNIIISNAFGTKLESTAEDLAAFINYKLENNLEFGDAQPHREIS